MPQHSLLERLKRARLPRILIVYLGAAWTVLERLGRPEEARRTYATFVEVWRNADPQVQPLVEHARQRLAALASEG